MSSGRKKSKKQKIKAPPRVTKTTFNLPTGDQFTTETKGNTETFTSNLSGATKNLVGQSQNALQQLAKEIRRPGADRAKAIQNRADNFFDLQSESINESSDKILRRTKSDLNKRFRGSLNATFGSDLLARVERDRLNRLSRSRKEANLLAEDLFSSDEASRVRRFALFQNYLSDLNNQARGLASTGSNILGRERDRSTRVAIAQANLNQQSEISNAQFSNSAANRRFRVLNTIVGNFTNPYFKSKFSNANA